VDDESPDWILRRTTDYQFVEHVARLESRVESLEVVDEKVRLELDELREMIKETTETTHKILSSQEVYAPTLNSINRLIDAGLVLRWIVLFTIGALAAVGTVATAWETFRSWLK
jgi:hypothetical protein